MKFVFLLCFGVVIGEAVATEKPNIILILADDLGYGDVGCYHPESRIPTPNMDRLAADGIRFTDAHSADSVCTPSRYGLLTGRYCWRTRLKRSVLFNWEPPLIEAGRTTLASYLSAQGYRTALSGKWHLGLGFTTKPGRVVDFDAPLPWHPGPLPDRTIGESIDFSAAIFGGPEELGFDDTFYTAGCSTDQEPFCFIENGFMLNMEEAAYRQPAGSWRSGMTAPDWENKTVDVRFTKRALNFIEAHHQSTPDDPFFLYLSLSSPHSPHVTADFAGGKSEAGTRGDMVWLVDWSLGQIDETLEALGIKDETLVIVTSDNGPLLGSLEPGAPEGTATITNGHLAAGDFRGQKGRVWEAGHRVPFLARWPNRIPKGMVSDYAFCGTDLLATFAELLESPLPEEAGEDSVSLLPTLLGDSQPPRPPMIHHSSTAFALRSGDWKIVFGQGENRVKEAPGQGYLFDLDTDPGETRDLWPQFPERVKELTAQFEAITQESLESQSSAVYETKVSGSRIPFIAESNYKIRIPNPESTVRALFVINQRAAGTHLFHHDEEWRAMAERTCSAILFCEFEAHGVQDNGYGLSILEACDQFAEQLNRPELKHAPFVLWGHSMGGRVAQDFVRFRPSRVLAFHIALRSNPSSKESMEEELAATKVPALYLMGAEDRKPDDIRQHFHRARNHHAPRAWIWLPGQGHWPVGMDFKKNETTPVEWSAWVANDVVIPWTEAVIELRMPANANPTHGPVELRELSVDSGWLGEIETGVITPYQNFPGDASKASWFPNQTVAKAWVQFSKPSTPQTQK
ncbi:MAG: sulfatase-like hydrolase/transferase [Verrucomicrobiota bacterium]